MINMSKESKLSPPEVLDRATRFFGEELGLEITQQDPCCIQFTGGGGFVTVSAAKADKTQVDVEGREWDYQVKQFLRRLH